MVGGLVGVALIAAVGLASRAHTPAGGGHTRSISQDILMEYLLLLSVGLAVVVLPVAVYLFIAGREEERPALPARKNWMMALLVSMIVLSVVGVLLLRYLHDHHGAQNFEPLVAIKVVHRSQAHAGERGAADAGRNGDG